MEHEILLAQIAPKIYRDIYVCVCTTCDDFTRTNFSESPLHLLTMEEAEMLKKVVLHSVATALASIVLPVPRDKDISI